MARQREPQQHLKIAEYLKDKIASGELKPGDQLPSEAELCALFSTSRGPVRQAMATLRAEGTISSGRGRRSVVLGSSLSETFESIYSITEWMELRGFAPTQKTLWLARRPAPAHVAKPLRINEGDPVVFVHRIRYGNDNPVMVERQYYRMDIGQKILGFDADHGSIHRELASQGVDFDNVHRILHIDYASEEDASALNVEPGAPLWKVSIQVSDHSGEPVEYSEYLYRADSLAMAMTSVRGGTFPLEVILRDEQSLSLIEDK